jgi:hypothetical protein
MAEVLCVYREVQVLKKAAAKAEKSNKPVAIVSYDEKPGIQATPRDIKARTQATHHGRHRRRQSPSRHPHLVLLI